MTTYLFSCPYEMHLVVKYIVSACVFTVIYALLSAYDDKAFSMKLTPFTALYFSIVTQSTVGFGDIRPTTEYAQVLVAIHIVVSIWLVLFPLSDLHQDFVDRRK